MAGSAAEDWVAGSFCLDLAQDGFRLRHCKFFVGRISTPLHLMNFFRRFFANSRHGHAPSDTMRGGLWPWILLLLFSCVSFGGLLLLKAESWSWTILSLLGLFFWFGLHRGRVDVSPSLRTWGFICLGWSIAALGSWAANGFLISQGRELDTPYLKFLLVPFIVFGLMPMVQVNAQRLANRIWVCYIIGAVLCFAAAYAQLHGWAGAWLVGEGRGRASGAVNPIYFGNISLLLGFLGLLGGLQLARRYGAMVWGLVGWFALLCGLMASVLSLSRGGWVALPFLLFIVVASAWSRRQKGRLIGIIGVFLAGILVAQTLVPKDALRERIDLVYTGLSSFDPNASQDSVGYRLRMWQHALEIAVDHPLFGTGPGSYVFETGSGAPRFWHAHSDYFNIAANLGLLGVLALLLTYVYPAWRFLRLCRSAEPWRAELALGGGLVVAGYAIFSLTDVMFYRSIGTVFYLGTVTFLLALAEPGPGSCSTRPAGTVGP
ncbi:Lipid A core - O-antigen ligase and related enzymes [plant metagenome]|uniref:Lipid A core - O-antigen ligase and related enzymes n=1 Tax=plant metagenome TaxID=1297885 RepID=A0A484S1U7_9ZZZZ